MNPGRARNGLLLLMAGRFREGRPDPVLKAMLRRVDRPAPRVAYIGAASGDSAPFFNRMKTLFLAAGAGAVELASLSDPARSGRTLGEADLVFLSGGDVEEGMRALTEAGADALLRDLFRAGKPFMGLSAGAIMLGRCWVRWRDPEDDATVERFPCLGFAPFAIDTHDEESDWEELKRCLALCPPGSVGYGIPSGAGLIVEPDGRVIPCGRKPAQFGG